MEKVTYKLLFDRGVPIEKEITSIDQLAKLLPEMISDGKLSAKLIKETVTEEVVCVFNGLTRV